MVYQKNRSKKLYPYPISNLFRYKISIIKFSIVYFISFAVIYLFFELPDQFRFDEEIPTNQILFCGLITSIYFIFLAIFVYRKILSRVKENLETEKIRELMNLLQEQKSESREFHKELEERTKMLEEQSEEIRRKNMELKLAQHEIKEKATHLEIASKYKSEFFANISHELRTPLNSIIVLSQLIAENRNENLTEKQIEFAKTIFLSGNVLLELINEILEITRIESGKIEFHPGDISIWELTDQLKKMFQPMAQQKDIEFSIELEENLPETIWSDSKRVHQILRNLISNAIKFTEKGSIRIRIFRPGKDYASESIPKGEGLGISVIDTGIGIPEDKRSAIFEAFQQADGTTSSRYGGTGLGLTISRSLAGLLGGFVKVKSQLGVGSEFTLVLPDRFSESDNREKNNIVNSPWKTPQVGSYKIITPDSTEKAITHDDREKIKDGDKTILIVDDDLSFANLLYDFATESGYMGIIATDGESALSLATKYRPGIIMLDICLPGLNGWEVFEKLKSSPVTSQIPVVFISGAKETNEVNTLGAMGFLSKPVSLEKLREVFDGFKQMTGVPVNRITGKKRRSTQSASQNGEKSFKQHKSVI